MSVYKDGKTNTWRVIYRYTDWKGEKKQTQKRGFQTKREAQAWEREQLNKIAGDLDMNFASFIETYSADMKSRIKENTWHTKEHIIRTKILPYFSSRPINEIQPKDIIAWQNEMINSLDNHGKPYSPVYLKTLHNQLSAIFNHAVKFYGLSSNPAAKVGNMGKAKSKEMQFWTQDEYKKFSYEMMDKPVSFYAFEMLYWCGIREGELLALTPADFDFERGTVSITKSYQRIERRDVITDPKTAKSNRVIKMPDFLVEEIQEYNLFMGAVCENYVAQSLAAKGYALHYWTSEHTAELDFVIQKGNEIIGIEVKKSQHTKSKSLFEFIKKYSPAYSIRLSEKNFGEADNNVRVVPLYAAFCI